MPLFRYTARDNYGRETEGTLYAEDDRGLRERLHSRSYSLISASIAKEKFTGVQLLSRFFGRVKLKDIALFSWNLYTMTAAGIPLIRSLDSVSNQISNERLKIAIADVVDKINSGLSFSEALKLQPQVFSPLFTHMVEVGEIGGTLDETLKNLAEYYDTQIDRRSRIISAISYPMVLMTGCICVVIFVMTFLVPRLFKLFENIGTDMPPTTVMLIKFSEFVRDYNLALLGAAAGLVVLLKLYLKTFSGQLARDQLLLRLPVAGILIRKIIFSRFSHTLSIMLKTGISLVNALNIVKELVQNLVFVKMVEDITEGVKEGSQINNEMRKHPMVPDMVIQMVSVGEETGTLEQMLAKVSEYYDREVNRTITNLTKVIEPMLLVIMAVIVGFIAISVLDPITDLMTNIGQ